MYCNSSCLHAGTHVCTSHICLTSSTSLRKQQVVSENVECLQYGKLPEGYQYK